MEKAPASKPFVQQNIFEPRYIKWDSFSDLPYEFEELFTFQGWMEFFELNEYYYPYLIQEFYGSMKEVVKGESFSVRVKKKSQIIDVEFLASVLNLPNDGNRIGTFKDSRKLEGYDEKAFQLSIFPEGTPENEMTNISLVPQNFRILQSFIRYLLNPRSGSHSYANSLDLCIMWHLVNKIRFNLPFLIFKVIAKSSKHRRLPYAMPLTLIFQAMGVDLSKEKKFSNPIPIKEIFKADDGRKRSKKEDKKQEEETEIEIESNRISSKQSDIPLSKLKETSSKIDEGESSKKKEKMKLKISDFVKISKANLDMMKEIKEMSGLTLSILEKSHELQKGIMAEHNEKMDMLINRLDRQEWFMKKMAQMLFGESFGKFGDFGSYPQGPSGVKISEVEEEAEEHVEAAEKVQEESKLAEVEEVEKNDEKEKSAEEASETKQEPANETSRESSSSHTTSNSSSDNGKSEGRNGSRQEEEKEEQSQDPSSEQPNIVPTASQPVPESTISLPMQYGPRRTKTQARKSVLPIPPKIQVPIPEKEPPKKKQQAKLVDPTHLRRSGRILSSKEKS
ncbi:eukaryotic translation initiation factor 3 subunit A-like [Hevea brasiliensis]|uniref:eukaryotic translation initiation factor 3 subunit A-like n=1 Tax=Hevea brasiliensis TaxID=3981 RepID=UPI0025F16B2C|nr:eukaryotic translation initiation factor 3 subunit A-like [Hevea brasiliensis]